MPLDFPYKIKLSKVIGPIFTPSCVFTDKDDTPFLLGRVGFIERFEMLLSARKKKLTFEKK